MNDFNDGDDLPKVQLLRMLKELANPASTFLLKPEVKATMHG